MTMTADRVSALEPNADEFETTPAELRFGLRHEGALDEDDLLDRRTRIGPVDEDRARAAEHAKAAVEHG
jgi:glycerol-3-phosphate dehydrogenase